MLNIAWLTGNTMQNVNDSNTCMFTGQDRQSYSSSRKECIYFFNENEKVGWWWRKVLCKSAMPWLQCCCVSPPLETWFTLVISQMLWSTFDLRSPPTHPVPRPHPLFYSQYHPAAANPINRAGGPLDSTRLRPERGPSNGCKTRRRNIELAGRHCLCSSRTVYAWKQMITPPHPPTPNPKIRLTNSIICPNMELIFTCGFLNT